MGVSNYRQLDCFVNQFFRLTTKKYLKAPHNGPYAKRINMWIVDSAYIWGVIRPYSYGWSFWSKRNCRRTADYVNWSREGCIMWHNGNFIKNNLTNTNTYNITETSPQYDIACKVCNVIIFRAYVQRNWNGRRTTTPAWISNYVNWSLRMYK